MKNGIFITKNFVSTCLLTQRHSKNMNSSNAYLKANTLACLFLVIFISSKAQTVFEVPVNADFSTGNCHAYDNDVINASKWLEETDIDKEKDKKKKVIQFVGNWLADCPYITVGLNDKLAKIYGKNYQLLGIYMASFARNSIENKDSLSSYKAVEAGINSMITVYKKGIGIKKSKEMEKLISLIDKNLLEYYIFQKFEIRKND